MDTNGYLGSDTITHAFWCHQIRFFFTFCNNNRTLYSSNQYAPHYKYCPLYGQLIFLQNWRQEIPQIIAQNS